MGVSYCATCDGAFFKGKTVAVVGGGDVAIEDAIFLSRGCEKVYLIHRRNQLRGAESLQRELFARPNIEVIWDSEVTRILGEAQNTTPAQMKMFLTRIGFGSKVIVTGDSTQKDLPSTQKSGLEIAMKVLKNVEDISFCHLTSKDVVRHPLVQKIVNAYEEYEKKTSAQQRRRQ